MEEYYKIFNSYVKTYDFNEPMIRLKFHHTYRVVDFCKEIAKSLELSDEDVKIAMIIGLFHDIGRFNQWKNYNTYLDKNSIDHADEGYRVLCENNFVEEKYKDIVLTSVVNHNKYEIDSNLDEKTKLFCNIIRDADKLDIISEQHNEIKDNEIVLKKEYLDKIYSKKVCSNEYVSTDTDVILNMLSWVFDLNFKYSYNYLLDKNIINKKFNLLEINGKTDEITKLKKYIYEEIEKRC